MKKISKLSTNLLNRNFQLAKLAFGTTRDFLKKEGSLSEKLNHATEQQIDELFSKLNVMKGSIMKAGQIISMYADDKLPESFKKIFNEIQQQSNYLDFEKIKKELPASFLNDLEIEPTPFAAASIGQVHLAIEKETGLKIALKIRYPDIQKAIGSDLIALKYLIKALKILPKKIKLESVMQEIRRMLEQEMDYTQELDYLKQYRELLKDITGVNTVTPVEKYCLENILATEYIDALSLEEACAQKDFTQDQKNEIASTLLKIYYHEIFKWGLIQTDAHFGNYLIAKDYASVIMLDFGATKKLDELMREKYANLIKTCIAGNQADFFKAAKDFGYHFNDQQQEAFWQYAQMIRAPHLTQYYDWGASNLDTLAVELIPKLMGYFPSGEVIGDTIFVDRKLMGLYYLLKKLNSKIKVDELYQKTLQDFDLK